MNTMKKLRKWIAERLYPLDFVDLTRSQISKVDREVILDISSMSKEESEGLLAYAHATFTNQYFQTIMAPLVFGEVDFIARFSRTNEETVLSRGTINGIERVIEEFDRLANAFKEAHQSELFNKFDVV